ncbi:MAG TPA: hypothetical protein PKD37_00755 [Oligoflexia bacterium]|nr:hypothetical protein [Oligoflexia bacterium]HMP26510.1 hypothetical protein [Oligoflexia bacterium]
MPSPDTVHDLNLSSPLPSPEPKALEFHTKTLLNEEAIVLHSFSVFAPSHFQHLPPAKLAISGANFAALTLPSTKPDSEITYNHDGVAIFCASETKITLRLADGCASGKGASYASYLALLGEDFGVNLPELFLNSLPISPKDIIEAVYGLYAEYAKEVLTILESQGATEPKYLMESLLDKLQKTYGFFNDNDELKQRRIGAIATTLIETKYDESSSTIEVLSHGDSSIRIFNRNGRLKFINKPDILAFIDQTILLEFSKKITNYLLECFRENQTKQREFLIDLFDFIETIPHIYYQKKPLTEHNPSSIMDFVFFYPDESFNQLIRWDRATEKGQLKLPLTIKAEAEDLILMHSDGINFLHQNYPNVTEAILSVNASPEEISKEFYQAQRCALENTQQHNKDHKVTDDNLSMLVFRLPKEDDSLVRLASFSQAEENTIALNDPQRTPLQINLQITLEQAYLDLFKLYQEVENALERAKRKDYTNITLAILPNYLHNDHTNSQFKGLINEFVNRINEIFANKIKEQDFRLIKIVNN